MQNNTNDYRPVTMTTEQIEAAADTIAADLRANPAFMEAMEARRKEQEIQGIETPEATESAETGRFQITDERSADWLLRKLANIDAEKERIRVWAKARAAELDADAARLNHLFGEQLRTWATEEAARRRRKSVTLPNGTLAFRTASARLIVADLDAAAEYAAAQGIATKIVLDGTTYREAAERAFRETGELWPGVERTEEQETFTVRFPNGRLQSELPGDKEIPEE